MAAPARRLTEMANLAGCTAKVGADDLSGVLGALAEGMLPRLADDDLIIGLDEPDDAAVYRIAQDRALVATVDFFAPIVDDPYDFGAISAANALSDIYAMGAEVVIALNILGVPHDLDADVVSRILRGGADVVAEAGGMIVGGHTVIDEEPKYGLCAIGFVHPDRITTKGGARPGDRVYLTKALGTGLITTAAKFEECEPDHLEAATASMTKLNRAAAAIAVDAGVTAMTDVTGFSLLGHAYEMTEAGGIRICLDAARLPLLPGAATYAYRGVITGGGQRNRTHLDGRVSIDPGVSDDFQHILFDPQTSGGLLFTLPEERASDLEDRFRAANEPLWQVGQVTEGSGVAVLA